MKNNKSDLIKIIWIIMLVILIGKLILNISTFILAGKLFEDVNMFEFLLNQLEYFLTSNIMLIAIFIGISIAMVKSYKLKFDESDFEKNTGYYREIIEKYSPGVLSYIDNFNIGKETLVATLMSLEKKNVIYTSEKIKVVDDTIENLSKNEKFVLDSIKNNKLSVFAYNRFKEEIESDCLEQNLISNQKQTQDFEMKKPGWFMLILIIMFLVMFFMAMFTENYNIISKLMSVYVIMFIGFVIFTFSKRISAGVFNKINAEITPYKRNKNAKEINIKLEGLKKYIKDFSNMQEKNKEALTLWEDYLIYSVLFGQNTKIIQEYESKF